MNLRLKILVVVIIAIIITIIGYFGLFKAKNQPQPPVNEAPKVEVIDTSDWQTYKDEMLGFEIKMPKGWVKLFEDIGPILAPEPYEEFWKDQIGMISFIPSYTKGYPQFSVRVKDTDLTLDRFMANVAITKETQSTIIAGFQAKKSILDGRKDKFPNYREIVVIKNDLRSYTFYFDASNINTDQDILIWHAILETFKPITK